MGVGKLREMIGKTSLALQKTLSEPTFSGRDLNSFLSLSITGMRIIKLKIFPVPVRLHSGNGKHVFVIISPFFCNI